MMDNFDYQGAKAAGYSDDEIASHLASTRKFDLEGAKKAGYSTSEVIGYLAGSPAKEVIPKSTIGTPPATNLRSKFLPPTPGVPEPSLALSSPQPKSEMQPGTLRNAANSLKNLYTQGMPAMSGDISSLPTKTQVYDPSQHYNPVGDAVSRVLGRKPPVFQQVPAPDKVDENAPSDLSNAYDAITNDPIGTGKAAFKADPFGTMALAGGIAKTAYGVPQTVRNLKEASRLSIPVAITKSLRPIPSNSDFPMDTEAAVNAIKGANPQTVEGTNGTVPFKPEVDIKTGKFNLPGAAQKAINAYKATLEPWFNRVEGQTTPLQGPIKATIDTVSRMNPSDQGEHAYLIDKAVQDYGGTHTAREVKDKLELINKHLNAFYNQSASGQNAALAKTPVAVLEAQRNALADDLYKFLDPENAGAGPRAIQKRISDIIDIKSAADRRSNAIVAEQPMTRIGQVIQEKTEPFKTLLSQYVPRMFLPPALDKVAGGAGLPFAEGSNGRTIPMLKRAFAAGDENAGQLDLGSMPRPGPRQIAAPADTSGPVPAAVRDFKSVGSPYAPTQKLLPAATSKIDVSGTIVPDTLGAATGGRHAYSNPAEPTRWPQKLLMAPQPGQPPINVPQGNPVLTSPEEAANAVTARPGMQMHATTPTTPVYDPQGQAALDAVKQSGLPPQIKVVSEPPVMNTQGQTRNPATGRWEARPTTARDSAETFMNRIGKYSGSGNSIARDAPWEDPTNTHVPNDSVSAAMQSDRKASIMELQDEAQKAAEKEIARKEEALREITRKPWLATLPGYKPKFARGGISTSCFGI